MNEVFIELKLAVSQSRVVDKAERNGNGRYTVYVRDDFNPSKRNDLEDLARELGRIGVNLNVRDKATEDDLRKLKIGGRVSVRMV